MVPLSEFEYGIGIALSRMGALRRRGLAIPKRPEGRLRLLDGGREKQGEDSRVKSRKWKVKRE
jgi:hypothetical protein